MRKRRSFIYENPQDNFDYESYIEMCENGFKDKDIAKEMNVSQSFIKDIKKEDLQDH